MLMMKPFYVCGNSATGDEEQVHGYADGTGDEDVDDEKMIMQPMATTTMLLVVMSQVTSR